MIGSFLKPTLGWGNTLGSTLVYIPLSSKETCILIWAGSGENEADCWLTFIAELMLKQTKCQIL